MSAPLAVPSSPSSSKRSRSRDSARSAATTPAIVNPSPLNATSFGLDASASAPSLMIPSPSQTPSIIEPSPQLDATPYPAFLRQARTGSKFVDLEWEQRRRLADGVQNHDSEEPSPWARVGPEVAVNRNRYANVDPYANNRVKLKVAESQNDYINASPIILTTSESETESTYIATQGPKAELVSHIWRMLWHETSDPAVIVMLTQTHESGREKCYPYYPTSLSSPILTVNEHDEFADGFTSTITLQSLWESRECRATIRELEMTGPEEGSTKRVFHLLFGGWPDFLVPEGADRAALLNLISLSRTKNSAIEPNPRVVHCSAGVGRSGTFIALDFLLQELHEGSLDIVEEDADPILELVDRLRQQRMMMVQGEAQFIFLYDVLREKWRERWADQHPEEAARLSLSASSESASGSQSRSASTEPRIKKLRPGTEDFGEQDEDERAELEAELVDGSMEFEQEKT